MSGGLGKARGAGKVRILKVEAEEAVGIEVVQRRPGSVPAVRELGVALVPRETIVDPFGDVGFRDVLQRFSDRRRNFRMALPCSAGSRLR